MNKKKCDPYYYVPHIGQRDWLSVMQKAAISEHVHISRGSEEVYLGDL
jgi:hypothetical protein